MDEERFFDLFTKSLDFYTLRANLLLEVSAAIPPSVAGIDFSDFESNICQRYLRLWHTGTAIAPPRSLTVFRVHQFKLKKECFVLREAEHQWSGYWEAIEKAVRSSESLVYHEPSFVVRDATVPSGELMSWVKKGSEYQTPMLIPSPLRCGMDDVAHFGFEFFNGPCEVRAKFQGLSENDPWRPFWEWYRAFWEYLESLFPQSEMKGER